MSNKLKSSPEDLYAFMKNTEQSRAKQKKMQAIQKKPNPDMTASSAQKTSWLDALDEEEAAEQAQILAKSRKPPASFMSRGSVLAGCCAVVAVIVTMKFASIIAGITAQNNFSGFLEKLLDNSVDSSFAQEDDGESLFGGTERKDQVETTESRELADAARTPLDEKDIAEGEISTLLKRNIKGKVQQLSEREQSLKTFEAMLRITEERLQRKQGALEQTKNEIKGLLEEYGKAQDGEQDRLVGIYASIPPKRAAIIFNELDTDIITGLMTRMPARKAAQILGYMLPEKARLVTESLSSKGQSAIVNVQAEEEKESALTKALAK